jgi:hypothetical protein
MEVSCLESEVPNAHLPIGGFTGAARSSNRGAFTGIYIAFTAAFAGNEDRHFDRPSHKPDQACRETQKTPAEAEVDCSLVDESRFC